MPWTKKDWIILLIVAILASPFGALVYYLLRTQEKEKVKTNVDAHP